MTVKIKLVRPYPHCRDLQGLVRKHKLTLFPLFGYGVGYAEQLRYVEDTTTESRRALMDCADVDELIVDRENSAPV